ncbi:hypothetical protein C6568_14010 [Melaminivora suipulveris]|uniref:Uncharacterized protein n=1 Tax=Melaminivora suipulveris TaxID=2109913 RepID=A0A2R3QEM4_9BURK|nr:hypothetical protein [Melaminivora suipulveris]AVO50238.1 hypothetical protein C6568_14010 [Melaminivora suipulveris]
MITVADAQKVITRTKQLVVPMGWAKKLNHTEPVWYEYRSALQFVDDPTETPEGLLIVCQWKRKDGPKPENWTFGLLYGGARIYAIDVQPLTHHTNKTGKGHPFHRQRIRGNHEHTWSEEGYGYAEPFTLSSVDGPTAWKEFLVRAGIANTPFVHPDKAINDGQQELGL